MAERILVVRNRFIGDTVLAIPFLRNLRRRFPAATIDVLVERGAGEALTDCPYKDALLTWHRPRRICGIIPGSLLNIFGYAVWLRSRRYDRAYILKRSLSSVLLAWLAGIGHRVGFASRIRTPLLTRQVPLQKSRHEAELFLDLLRGDGIDVDDGHNENWVWPAAAAKVATLLAAVPGNRPRAFIAPQATDGQRLWPLERMAAVITWLVNERGYEVFVCGGPKDRAVHAAILASLGAETAARVHDFSRELSLRETTALLSRMDLCLGVDTGLPHIAASFGVPVITLCGPTDPRQWHPWKTRSTVVKSASSSMAEITVEQVRAAVAELLDSIAISAPAAGRPRREMRTIDLRQGRHRYDVYTSTGTTAVAAAEPATKPLAHAH